MTKGKTSSTVTVQRVDNAIPKITAWHTVDTVIVVLNNLYFRYMSSKQNSFSDIYVDRSGFGSKAVTLQDARKKG